MTPPIEKMPWVKQAAGLRLASASPRRLELLRQIGIEPEVFPVDLDESTRQGESPKQYVRRLARAKAEQGAKSTTGLCLGSDTAVIQDGLILCKPRDAEEALAMLQRLSGRTHSVLTAVAVCHHNGTCLDRVVTTKVTFRPLSKAEILAYIATGEPMDKAGAYGIQGVGGAFVLDIEGSYHSVVGLPLVETLELLQAIQ